MYKIKVASLNEFVQERISLPEPKTKLAKAVRNAVMITVGIAIMPGSCLLPATCGSLLYGGTNKSEKAISQSQEKKPSAFPKMLSYQKCEAEQDIFDETRVHGSSCEAFNEGEKQVQ